MLSTMPDFPLTVSHILEHGRTIYPNSQVVTAEAQGVRRITFDRLAKRVECLAAALRRLGIHAGDRVGTFCWNTQEHLEAYLAVPTMGAVLHTVNIRLFPDQIKYVINHAEDAVLIVDDSLIPQLAAVAAELKTVRLFIVVGSGDAAALPGPVARYEELLAAEAPGFAWPTLDERSAAAMCYTSGTTGNPKGVVYSHRSTFLHSLGVVSAEALGINERDRVLPVVPMFHANAWGLPYAGWMVGADFVLPGRFAQAVRLAELIAAERVTLAAGVPTLWFDLLQLGERQQLELSSLRLLVAGGAAVPRPLIEAFQERYNVQMVQGWGLTETSPVAALAYPPRNVPAAEAMALRATAGRIVTGVELRLMDSDGNPLPWDGQAIGEIAVRGPWVTAGYYRESTPGKFHEGWLRTGDVGSIDPLGYIHISDRSKDVIKSGGEWISSLELEAAIVSHVAVREVAVVAVPDERWGERPLACVVLKEGAAAAPEELRAHLVGRVARWWIPEHWAFVDQVPRTSVGKHDKKVLRAALAAGELRVTEGVPTG
jgi:fatty-acyl-CoA synthase